MGNSVSFLKNFLYVNESQSFYDLDRDPAFYRNQLTIPNITRCDRYTLPRSY